MEKQEISKKQLKRGLRRLAGGSPAKDRKESISSILGFHNTSFPVIKCHVMPLDGSHGGDITLDLEDITDFLWDSIYKDEFKNYNLYDWLQAKVHYDDFIEVYSDPLKIVKFKMNRSVNEKLYFQNVVNPLDLYNTLNELTQRNLKDFLPKATENYNKAIKLKRGLPKELSEKTKSKTVSGVVYLLERTDKPQYKIGVTTNMERRLNQLTPKMPFEVIVANKIKSNDIYGLEAKLHKKYKDKHINGEWFALDKKDVEYIKSIEGDF
ncbi:MAG: GIY-YIG nuclease family protein [Eubacteriales bacterium]